MKVQGRLTGLTPKEKGETNLIEIKILTAFNAKDFAELGKLFGSGVSAEITSQQLEINFVGEK